MGYVLGVSVTQATPLLGPPPTEVPLATPPLLRVIVQVRFPVIVSVEKREFIAPFQEELRHEYPVLRPEQTRSFVFDPNGVRDTRPTTAWRFYDLSSDWRVTLAPDFLALETGRYTNRDDFLSRLRAVLQALETHVSPAVVDRLGVRYIDRVTGPTLLDLPSLVRPEVSGILATSLAKHVVHSVTETVFELPEDAGRVTVRWGQVPGQSTVDPAAIPPIDEPSWLLDLDAFSVPTSNPRAFDVEEAVLQAEKFTRRIYSIFRWAVTDEFLRRYGGQP